MTARNALHLCANCLQGGANGVPVGHEKGSQRDPFHETIPLCRECAAALLGGDLGTFSARYRVARWIGRDGEGLRERLIAELEQRDFALNKTRDVRDQGPLTPREVADVVMEVIAR